MEDIFFQRVSKEILLSLAGKKRKYVSEIANEIKSTYAHTFNLIKEMENLGILESIKKGRTKYIRLSSKGEMLALNIKSFNEILSGRTDKTITRVTPTIEKLIRYRESLLSMKKELQSKNISKKDRYNKARVLGRFKSLNNKLKPRNKEGRELKEEVSSLIREIEMLVGTPK